MKKQYFKVVDDSGRILIPHEQRKAARLQENDIVRISTYKNMLIMEKVDIPYVDVIEKLKKSFADSPEESVPNDVECFIVTAISRMDKNRQNIEDFAQPGIAEMTKPLFAIPTHQFLFNPGNISPKIFMDMLQLEECLFDLIKSPQRGVCVFRHGVEIYNLVVKAQKYKEAMFGAAGGR